MFFLLLWYIDKSCFVILTLVISYRNNILIFIERGIDFKFIFKNEREVIYILVVVGGDVFRDFVG